MSKDIWRKYVIRKYVTARSAVEAIALSEDYPIIEVNEMNECPETCNQDITKAVGFQNE